MKTEHGNDDREAAIDGAFAEYLRLVDQEGVPDLEEFLDRYADIAEELRALITTASTVKSMADATIDGTPAGSAGEMDTLPLDSKSMLGDTVYNGDLVGEYELVKEIGRGGMGVVYKARQKGMNRLVALKMIIGGRYSSDESVRRFYREAKAAGKLAHPNIVRAIAAGSHEGRHFFAMELIEGRTLRDVLRKHPEALPVMTVARYMKGLAAAVQYAHEKGILHRDLKPSNVIVDQNDTPKVADFGLAKHMDVDADCSFDSVSGSVVGTPSYMSPEQATSQSDNIGPQSDVYSLGAILYEMLTGKPPYRDETPVGTLLLVLNEEVEVPSSVRSGVHPDLEAICLKCLEKEPADRYRNCEELEAEFDHVLAKEPVKARRLNGRQKAWMWLRDVPLVAYAIGRDTTRTNRSHHLSQWGVILTLCLLIFGWSQRTAIVEYSRFRRVEIAVAGERGMYDEVGHLIDQALRKSQLDKAGEKKDERVLNTVGSAAIREMLLDNEADLGIVQENAFEFAKIVGVTPLFREAVVIIARRDRGIRSALDLQGRAVALGPPASGSRITSDQILRQLDISTDAKFQDVPWTSLEHRSDLDGAIATVSLQDSRLREILSNHDFELLPLQLDDAFGQFQSHGFKHADLPDGSGYPASSKFQTLSTKAVLVVRTSAPDWFVEKCLKRIYSPQDGRLSALIFQQEAASNSAQLLRLHPAATKFFGNLGAERSPVGQ